jgi:hypothetical protein
MSEASYLYINYKFDIQFYEEAHVGDAVPQAHIAVTKDRFKVDLGFDSANTVTIQIPPEVMDDMAIEWCTQRQRQGDLSMWVKNGELQIVTMSERLLIKSVSVK